MCRGFPAAPGTVPQCPDVIAACAPELGAKYAKAGLVIPEAVRSARAPPVPGLIGERVVHKTVFFVRHGQALHNVVEEHVKDRAAREAKTCGYAKVSEQFQAMVKQARVAALSDETLRDAALSELGKAQLLETKRRLERMTSGPQSLHKPTAVLVSPLFRTLQSAAILFPEHPDVHVCKVIRERNTGLPCDACSDQSRVSFHFPHVDFDKDLFVQCESNSIRGDDCEEDAAALRQRTADLAQALRAVEDETVAVVSHKAFLRELERGPLHHVDAKEFKPAELRVFDVALWPDGSMDAIELKDSM